MILADIPAVPSRIAKIVDHSATDLGVRSRIYTYPRIHRHAVIASYPTSAIYLVIFIHHQPRSCA